MANDKLSRIVNNNSRAIGRTVNDEPDVMEEIDSGTAYLQSEIEKALKTHKSRIDNIDKKAFGHFHPQQYLTDPKFEYHYPTEEGSFDISTGFGDSEIKVTVAYSGVPAPKGKFKWLKRAFRNFWQSEILENPTDYEGKLVASIRQKFDFSQVEPLKFTVPENLRRRGDHEFENRVAEYLLDFTDQVYYKCGINAQKEPLLAEFSECFEGELVGGASRILQCSDLPRVYLEKRKGRQVIKGIQKIKQESEDLVKAKRKETLDVLEGVKIKASELEALVGTKMEGIDEEIRTYAQGKKIEVTNLVTQARQKIEDHKNARYAAVETQAKNHGEKKKKELMKELGRLEEMIAKRRSDLKERKGDLKSQVYFTNSLEEVFPNYDTVGRDRDITPAIRAQYGLRLERLHRQKSTELSAAEIMQLVKLVSASTSKSEGRRKFVNSEGRGVIGNVEWIVENISAEEFPLVQGQLETLHRGKKKFANHTIKAYLEPLFEIRNEKKKSRRTRSQRW
ncbi:hypothetical protein GOV14_00545 [Candidatus Pacearchaeota archaeon]|nr:hypothetical protein [Candidatus Pacearchaeota archaeon]